MDSAADIRFSRHFSLPEVGTAGQARLAKARVLVVGLGGLGSPAALYLAAAGTGHLYLADYDTVETSNLQRQIAHDSHRIGSLKVESARSACLAINPDIDISLIRHGIDADDALEHVRGMDVVLDCSDNVATRLALNDASLAAGVPLIIGAASRFDGQLMQVDQRAQPTARGDKAPCYRCFIGERELAGESCAQVGILGPVVGTIGCLQALEAIKLILGIGESLSGRLLVFDGLSLRLDEIRLKRRSDCSSCGERSGQDQALLPDGRHR